MTISGLPPFPPLARLRVLVLEDNPFERRMITALLERLGVGHVEEAGSGGAALALVDARPHPFDVVLCDLQVHDRSDLDGIEFLRLAGHRLACPLILVSGVDEDIAIAAESLAVAGGATWGGRLRKPVIPAELQQRLVACTVGPAVRTAGPAPARPGVERSVPCAADLRAAIARHEFAAWFQPQRCLATGRLFGVEALARWQHPRDGIVGPADFVPMMEREGMVDALFDIILERSLDAMAAWAARGVRVPVSINASPLTLENIDVPNRWRARVEAHGFDPGQITIEVTETAVAHNFNGLLESVTRLRMHGFRVALDDFGTSYSSLQQLSELPATEVKIDRSFLDQAARYPRARVIFERIVTLGRDLGLAVVAEGVETLAQNDFVRAMGCDAAQGWLHGHPVPPQMLALDLDVRPAAHPIP
jgi:EAL domain-containing protein (putative c-di-GMP-specific phosphodiesterase class I)/CheY-like chemotaxis protein